MTTASTLQRNSETSCLWRVRLAHVSRSFPSAASLAVVSASSCWLRPEPVAAAACWLFSCCSSRSRRALSKRAAFRASCALLNSACSSSPCSEGKALVQRQSEAVPKRLAYCRLVQTQG